MLDFNILALEEQQIVMGFLIIQLIYNMIKIHKDNV